MTLFWQVLKQQIDLAFKQKTAWLNPVLFFALVTLLFPLALGASTSNLAAVAPGLVWVTALLATLLSLETLFREDETDGTLELWCANQPSLLVYAYAKLTAHWALYCLPLVVVSPILAYSVQLPLMALPTLILSLFLGSIVLVFVGAIGVAITTGLKYNSFLLALLVLPFYVPVLIFGASAVELTTQSLTAGGPLYVLGALAVFAVTLAPLAVAKALELSMS